MIRTRFLVIAATAIVIAAGGAFTFVLSTAPALPAIDPPSKNAFKPELVERGEVLATLGDCAVCHTRQGGRPYAGGLALETPFGTIRTTNITPDKDTGIGTWSEAAFTRAMREGVGRDGQHLYPAFPFQHFAKVTTADIQALYAFVMTRPAVKSDNEPHQLRFPFDQRRLLAGWKLLFLDRSAFRRDPSKSDTWNAGAYMVDGLGHCGSCHTPRNQLGAEMAQRNLAGGEVEGWHAPALADASRSAVPWTVSSMTDYLIDGRHGHHGIAAGPMKDVVDNIAKLPEEMVTAMATYLTNGRTEAPGSDTVISDAAKREFVTGAPIGAGDPGTARGEAIFARACANCHRAGTSNTPLALTATVRAEDPANVIRITLDGIKPPEGSPDRSMPRFGSALSDDEIGDLLAFIRQRFTSGPTWQNLPAAVRAARQH
jgi:mono/diheme cytochrome c family protein